MENVAGLHSGVNLLQLSAFVGRRDSPLPFPDSGIVLRGGVIPDLMLGNGVQLELAWLSSSLLKGAWQQADGYLDFLAALTNS